MNRTSLKTKHSCEFSAAKKTFLFLSYIMSTFALSAASCVSVKQINSDYKNNKIVVSITWTGCGGDMSNHRNTAWVFVDYRAVTGATKTNTWNRATVSMSSAGTVVNSGASKGVWIYGTNGTSQTITLTLNSSGLPTQYDWCAFATDYPPNAVTYTNGIYTLRGTKPFAINGVTVNSTTYSGGIINVLTDATGCPGWFERDVATTSGTCQPNLIRVGGYCRNLPADEASTYIGCGFEIKATDISTTYPNRNQCPSGWHVPTFDELRCMWNARNQINLTNGSVVYWSSSTSGNEKICASGRGTENDSWFILTFNQNAIDCGNSTGVNAGEFVWCQGCLVTSSLQRVRCVR